MSDLLAAQLIETLEGRSDLDVWERFARANAYAELGRFEDAIADYETVLEHDPGYESGLAWSQLGHALHAVGRLAEAAEAYRAALDTGTDEWAPFFGLATVCMQLGRRDEALSAIDAYLATEPSV